MHQRLIGRVQAVSVYDTFGQMYWPWMISKAQECEFVDLQFA